MPAYGALEAELAVIQQEIEAEPANGEKLAAPGILRKRYVEALSQLTGRTTILYYSGFQQRPDASPSNLMVSSSDMSGFMEVCSNVTERDADRTGPYDPRSSRHHER